MPAYPLATPPSRVVRTEEADERLLAVKGAIHELVSSSCTSGKKGTGAGRGCEPRPAPRNQSSSREGSGLGGLLTSSPMLTAARASMAVSSGSGAAVATTPEGGSPTAPSSSEDVNPSPNAAIDILSTDGAPNEMLGAPWDRPAKITREPDGMFAAWGVRGPWGRARRRGSYSNPQISQSVSRRSSARAREISTGGGRGCQSFHKGKARSQRDRSEIAAKSCSYAHNRRMSHPRTQLQHVGSPDTEDNDRVRHPQTENDRNQKDTDETASWKRRDRPWFALLEFALSVEVPRGIADEMDSADRTVTPTGNKTKMNGFVEISTLLIHSAPKQKSNEWMHLSPFYTRMHGEWLRYAKSTSQFHWRFLLVRDVRGFQVNPLCRHDITRSDRQIGNSGYNHNIYILY